jgi:hypothetical protein
MKFNGLLQQLLIYWPFAGCLCFSVFKLYYSFFFGPLGIIDIFSLPGKFI